jgi:alpha-glucosidase
VERSAYKWWQKAVFYQIYPRSFADGNGDGIGDFTGITAKLNYLQELGIDAIWLSPHFPSPFIDCGYDVADYEDVGEEYGTLDSFKQFLTQAHQKGMRVVLDLVLNHTSDQHPWFIESRSSRDNPKRDWYIWRDGVAGDPPNNWFSTFGGSAWEFDARTRSYYYHYFFKEQPDLNCRNPAVKEGMFSAARFWLAMGVDGFRLDAVGTIYEDETYPSIPASLNQEELYRLASSSPNADADEKVVAYFTEMFHHQVDKSEVHQLMRELRELINEYDDRVLIGETDAIEFYGDGSNELHLNFNFPLMRTRRLTAQHVKENQAQRLGALPAGAWPCNTLGNHDASRVFSAFGDGVNNEIQAKLHLMLLLTLKGTPFLYNGEEIGMSDLLIDDPALFRDPLSLLYAGLEKRVNGSDEQQATRVGALMGRDRNRTPMQWSGEAHGGFCPAEVTPWLPVNPDHTAGVNVKEQVGKPDSLINFYRRMLEVRRQHPALQIGEYHLVDLENEQVLGYIRSYAGVELMIVLNLGDEQQQVTLPRKVSQIVINNMKNWVHIEDSAPTFLPYQGIVYRVA